jgi:hypothetical protein
MSNWQDQRYTAHRHDHERDYRKHEARPGDRGFSPPAENEPPTRMAVECSGALEIAILAQAVSLTSAAALIDQYARTVAAAARMEATAHAIDLCCTEIEKHGGKVDA